MSLRVKRKRVDLPLSRQVDVIEELDRKGSQSEVARRFGISQSQVSRISANKSKILSHWEQNENPDRKRCRSGKDADVEMALKQWVSEARRPDIPLSGSVLKEKAKELAETLNKPDFIPTTGWLCRWKDRCFIEKSHRENNNSDVLSPGDLIKENIPKLVVQYSPENVYSAAETGVYFRAIPEGTLSFKNENSSDEKEWITVLVTCNMSGTDRRRLLVIGKNKSPCGVDGVTGIPVDYVENKTAWMTPGIFRRWCCDFDRDMKKQKRNIMLIVNSCSSHPPDTRLTNIKLCFLPSNTAMSDPIACIHPCEQGILRILKCLYRKQIIHRIVTEIDNGEGIRKNLFVKEISLLDAMHMLQKSWHELNKEIIVNCFGKSGFLEEGHDGGNKETTEQYMAPVEIAQSEFDKYVNIDKNVGCFGFRADEDICADVLQAKLSSKSKSADSSKLTENKESITSAAALRALMTVRRYLECHGVDNFHSFYALETDLYSTIRKPYHRTQK